MFLPFLRRMGADVSLTLERYGFYPAGGGCFSAQIQPCPALRPITLGGRGPVYSKHAKVVLASLPPHIAERELATVRQGFGPELQTDSVLVPNSPGPGNALMIELQSQEGTEIFTGFGEIGVSAENVARNAIRQARDYIKSDAVAGEHLADQLLLPLALAGGGSFTALKLNRHTTTNMEVIQRFLPVRFETLETPHYIEVRLTTDHR